ncbi:Hypothetical protein PHPALM_20363 [Phytophthora palmivora]|uniref:HAT C-terminal dimerisation domain-containing protein n=1 Tax=Phytophthora palmivora TaxID=4796 RepID=A0A2P4XF20_9STRA|nr:Hypothetical protein PHPALM_20363 [Phytophthora palmivora]
MYRTSSSKMFLRKLKILLNSSKVDLKKKGEKRRRLTPVPTRWYTHETCVTNVFHNRYVIAAIFADTALRKSYEGADLDAVLVIQKDEAFWQHARIALDLIRPNNTSLAAFERDNCGISMVYHQLDRLRTHDVYTIALEECDKELQQSGLGEIENRREKICSKTLAIANMLDQTKPMDYRHVEGVKTVIIAATKLATKMGMVTEAQSDGFHKELQEFVLEKDSWDEQMRADHFRYSPLNWWSLPSKTNKFVREFAKSIHGFIHTKIRNRLTPERVNKLVFVYTNIALKYEVNHILYQLLPDACDDEDLSDSSGDDSSDDDDDNLQEEYSPPPLGMAAAHSEENCRDKFQRVLQHTVLLQV